MPVVEIAAAILGSELIKTCWQGAVGNYVHDGCEWIRGKILNGSPQSQDVLKAMHRCFRQSIKIMAEACSKMDGANADGRLARRKLGDYARSKAFATLDLNTPDIPEDVLEAQIRKIYGNPPNGAGAAATEQVIAFVERQIGCALTPSLREVFHNGNGDVGPWAANFELLFAAEVKRNAEVRSILLFARANELAELVENASTRIEALFDHLDQIEARVGKAFEEQHGRHDGTQDLIREGHRLHAGDLIDRVEAALDLGSLDSSQKQRLRAIAQHIETQVGVASQATELAAQTAFRLELSNESAKRAVAEFIEAGDLLGAAQLRAKAAEESLADEHIRAAAALREAGRLAAPLSPGNAREYFERATVLDPDFVWGWVELGRLERDYRGIDAARPCFNKAMQRAKESHHRAALAEEFGNLERSAGNLKISRQYFRISNEIAKQEAKDRPDDILAQRNLSVSHNKLGNIDFDIGDTASAFENFLLGLEIRKSLARRYPDNNQLQHDLSFSHNSIGYIYAITGNASAARPHLKCAIEIRKELSQREPDNKERQHNLAISYELFGDVEFRLGDISSSRHHLEYGAIIAEKISTQEPDNIRWSDHFAQLSSRLGDIEFTTGDFLAAKQHIQKAVGIRKQLTTRDPGNCHWRRELSMSLSKLGDVERAMGRYLEASRYIEGALEIAVSLTEQDPDNVVWQRDLFADHVKLGQIHEAEGNRSVAIQQYELAEAVISALVNRCRDQTSFVIDLVWVLTQLARLRENEGQSAA